jgi:hypothetical protein
MLRFMSALPLTEEQAKYVENAMTCETCVWYNAEKERCGRTLKAQRVRETWLGCHRWEGTDDGQVRDAPRPADDGLHSH